MPQVSFRYSTASGKPQTILNLLICTAFFLSSFVAVGDESQRHYMSGLVGTGVALTQRSETTAHSIYTASSFRLMFDLRMSEHYLFGFDLDWLRIKSREDEWIPHRLDAEGLAFVAGYRQEKLTFWGKVGGGRMFARRAEPERNQASRYPYYQTALGMNWAFYQTKFVWVEGLMSLGLLTSGPGWNEDDGPRNLGLSSLLISIKLFDL